MIQPPCTVRRTSHVTVSEATTVVPRHVLIDVIPSRALFQRAWALLHGGSCDNSIIACLITVIPFYSIPFHSISRSIDSGMPLEVDP